MMVIRTNHDTQTNYLYTWTAELIKKAEEKQFKITLLEGENITLKNLKGKIKARRPAFIFFNGHGSSTSLYDNNKKPFVDTKSSGVFKNTVVFTRACDCLKELGVSAIKTGCFAFVGYMNKFWIARIRRRECQPLKDNVAKPVLECSNIIVKELIKGKTVEEAVQKSHIKSAERILELIYSKEPTAFATLQAIVANDASLDFLGEPSATIL